MSTNSDPRGPWYRDGIRFRCTEAGKCCHAHGEYDRVYLDDGEAHALATQLGMEFAAFEAQHVLHEDGHRLIRFRDGACPFLDGKHCSVYQARPRQCSSWPFWRENLKKKVWDREIASFCPGIGQGPLFTREQIDTIADQS